MNETLNSKDAFFALDTDIEQDMDNYKQEVTNLVIKHINSTPAIYRYVIGNKEHKLSVKDSVTTWANNHNHEFGELFVTELDIVDWKKVEARL